MDFKKYNFVPDFNGFHIQEARQNNRYIGIERAKQIALNHAGLRASQVYFTKQKFDIDDGIPIYEIEFMHGRYEYEYEIDAASGRIREWNREIDD